MRWRSWLKWLWKAAWTELNFCSVFIRLNLSMARSRRRNGCRNRAAFVDKADDDGVFPRTYPDKDPAAVQETFQDFYASTVTYDLTRQWIVETGPFHYRYNWLVQKAKHEEMKDFGDRHFHSIYDVWPDDIEILTDEGGDE